MKNVCSVILKCCTVLSAFGGVCLGQISARADGYTSSWRRLLYFTAQSNLWLGMTLLFLLLFLWKRASALPHFLYVLRYIFTVSIALTGLVFCCILAPFADKGYTPWTLTNVLTHVVTPFLALFDCWFDRRGGMGRRGVALSVLPPLGYVTVASALGLLHFDFGRGVCYPYFFMNYCSPVGMFGVGGERPFVIGALYWLVLLFLIVLLLARGVARLGEPRK